MPWHLQYVYEHLLRAATRYGYGERCEHPYLSLFEFIQTSRNKADIYYSLELSMSITKTKRRSLINEYFTREVLSEMVGRVVYQRPGADIAAILQQFREEHRLLFGKESIPARYGALEQFVRRAVSCHLSKLRARSASDRLLKDVYRLLSTQ